MRAALTRCACAPRRRSNNFAMCRPQQEAFEKACPL
jgi:hypothetical protein